MDEATNSLDANNERAIVENLEAFYRDKTVVVVAHRLSTVKNPDQIGVLDGQAIKIPAPFTFPAKIELKFTIFLEWVMGKDPQTEKT